MPATDTTARLVIAPGGTTSPASSPLLTTAPPAHRPPARRPAGGPSEIALPLGALAAVVRVVLRLVGVSRTRARGLTDEDIAVLVILGIGAVVTFGAQVDAQVDFDAAAPIEAPAGLAAPVDVAPAAQVLDLARAEIGTVEGPGGGTPYHQAYGIAANQPWCAVFLWDLFQDAGGVDSIGPKTAYTPTLAGWFQSRGQWSASPAVGALVFYDWPGDSKDRISHVGIVESFDATSITTIEANTSNSDEGSQDDGDGVWRRTRDRDNAIVGYGLPSYGLPR